MNMKCNTVLDMLFLISPLSLAVQGKFRYSLNYFCLKECCNRCDGYGDLYQHLLIA